MTKQHEPSISHHVNRYNSPAIKHSGVLQQFTGSPLSSTLLRNPLNIPGQ